MPPASSTARADSDLLIKDEIVRALGSELLNVRTAQGQLQDENEGLRRQLEETHSQLRALEEEVKERARLAEDAVSVRLQHNREFQLQLSNDVIHA